MSNNHQDIKSKKNETNGLKPNAAGFIEKLLKTSSLWKDQYRRVGITIKAGNLTKHYLLDDHDGHLHIHREFQNYYKDEADYSLFQEAIILLKNKAVYEGEPKQSWHRVGWVNGKVCYDLTNDNWEMVECTDKDWTVKSQSDIIFLRSPDMLPQCTPVKGGTLENLEALLNTDEEDKKLIIGFLVYGLMNVSAPNPILLMRGEQGTGKTFAAGLLVSLLSPTSASLRMLPSNHEALAALALKNRVCAFDNVSAISDKLSDSLCTISTGITASVKTSIPGIVTTGKASCPIIINSIHDVVRRPDLLDRSLNVLFKQLEERIDSEKLTQFAENTKPHTLGVLFDGVVAALANKDKVAVENMPRMADFARVVTAAESGLGWPSNTFMQAYAGNIEASAKEELDNNMLARAVLLYMKGKKASQRHTATEWVRELQHECQYEPWKMHLPVSPISLSNELARIAPLLRTGGLEVERIKSDGSRAIRITRIEGAWTPDVQEESFGRYLPKVKPMFAKPPKSKS
jgi:hypothetical protein